MRIATTSLALLFAITPAIAQQKSDGPSDEKAQKTYKHALAALHDRRQDIALDEFKKADKTGRRTLLPLPEADDQIRN